MVQSSTGTGNVSFISDAGTIENLVAISESELPAEGKPALSFPYGFFSFKITGLSMEQTVNVTIAFPSNIPMTAQYWKYDSTEGWYQIPIRSNDGDNIIIIQLTDGGIGDDDGIVNGVIVDAGGLGIPRWTYIFEDSIRNTKLFINTNERIFQFITPDKDYGIKECPNMYVSKNGRWIMIRFRDNEISLFSISIDTKNDFCYAFARDMQTRKRYILLDRWGIE
jgi:hypothetical protein